MTKTAFKPSTHFGIVWGVMLVFITLVEWRGLDRDPLGQEIMSPFISRHVTVNVNDPASARELEFSEGLSQAEDVDDALQYAVDIQFNGPLFLLCFFGPVLLFHGISVLLARLRGS